MKCNNESSILMNKKITSHLLCLWNCAVHPIGAIFSNPPNIPIIYYYYFCSIVNWTLGRLSNLSKVSKDSSKLKSS